MNAFSRMILCALTGLLFPLQIASAQDHQITPFRHNHPGAVTIGFDDGLTSQVTNAVPLLNAKGLKATFFVVTGSMDVTWDQWRQVAAQGHEIGSHTVTHPDLTSLSDSNLRYELSESQRAINQNIPSQSCISLAYPENLNNSHVQAVTSEYYISARAGWAQQEGGDMNFYQDPDPSWPLPPNLSLGAYRAVNFYDVAGDNAPYSMPLSNLDDKLDFAIARHAWYDMYFHDIPDQSYYIDYFATLLDHIVARDIWMATYGEVAQYMRERMASTLSVLSSDSSVIQLSLTNSLNGTFYKEPLTIRSIVPSAWLSVSITQGSSSTIIGSTVEGASTVVYYDAVPNGGTIVLTQAVTNPDFSLSTSPTSQTVLQGGPASYTVTVNPIAGFNGQVNFSVTGLPTGASGSFNPNPGTSSSTLSVATAANTPLGSYSLTITGVSGGLTHTSSVTLVVSTPDFALSASPSTQSVPQGRSTSYGITITPVLGFAGQVTLSVSGLPAGATGSFNPNPAISTSTLSVTTSAGTPVATSTVTVTGVSGALIHNTTVSLTVAPTGVSFDNKVSSDIQFGVTKITTPAFTVGSGPNRAAMIMVAMSANTATGISASLGGVSATLVPGTDSGTTASGRTVIFQVINPPSGPQTAIVSWTGSMTADVGVITVSGADQTTPINNGAFAAYNSAPSATTSLTISSNSGDLTASIGYTSDSWKSPFTNQTLKWGVDSGEVGGDVGPGTGTTTHAWTDSYAFQTVAVSGANFRTASTPDFSLSATPSTQTVLPGNSTSYGITVNQLNGFSGQVTLSVSGLPTGATGNFTTNPATTTSTLSVTTASNTPAGTYTLTITGDSGNIHTTTVTLVVTAPDFSLSATPSTQTVAQGSPASYNLTINALHGFSGQVSLSVSGLPAGANGSFTQNPATSTSTLSVTTDPTNTPPGTYTLTITGVSDSLTHTTTVTLVVTAPDFTLSAAPASQTAIQGNGTSYSVTVTPTNGFGGQVTLSVTGLPSGANGSFSPNPATSASTLSVTTSTTTPAGTYTLTITGVSGALTHTTTVTLVVTAPDFSLSRSPASQTVTQGNATSYGVTINPTNGFAGQVTLSVTGLPTGAGGSFAPNPATTSSTLSVTTIATTPTGTYTLTITGVSGSPTHTTTVTLVVAASGTKQATTTTLTSSLNPSLVGQAVTFTATVTSAAGGTPTGTVTFKQGANVLGTGTLTNGQATFTTTSLAAGTKNYTAAYGGDANYKTSTSAALSQAVNKNATTTTATSSLNPSTYGQSVTFTATVTSSVGAPPDGETVTFKRGTTTLGTGTLSGGVATFSTNTLAVGTPSITATYATDAKFLASTSTAITQTVSKAATTASLVSAPNPSVLLQSVTFTATLTSSTGAIPTGSVSFKQGTTTLGKGTLNAAGVATFSTTTLAAGSHVITAVYATTTNFLAATSPSVTQVVQ
jgi:peptidoglycan/xylan/chitin deacetylase (PgdA/CDA1 family)/uncharacterized membrane protein